jgi:hypothetical protein
MLSDSQDWAGALTRVYRVARDAEWWLRLSVHNAVVETIEDEADRVVADARKALPDPQHINGTLRRSLSK